MMNPMDEHDVTDELGRFLAHRDRQDVYRVERVLKRTPFETTELVYFPGPAQSELGPFVRKRIALDAHVGASYEALFAAQRSGVRLAHVPRMVECARLGDELTVVLEYVPGRTLAETVRAEGGSLQLAARVFPAICTAVAELHTRLDPPLIHRDLKPSNIVLAGEGPCDAVLIDFGIARLYRAGAETDTAHFGTRGYAAPEQYGFVQTDVRTDVYALGAVLAYCCCGIDPTGALDPAALRAHGMPEPVLQVALKAAAFDPSARFASTAELARASQAACAEALQLAAAAPEVDGAPRAAAGGSGGMHDDGALREAPTSPASQGDLVIREADAAARVPAGADEPLQEPGAAPTGAHRRAAPAWGRLLPRQLNRIPAWIGVLWNAAVLIVFIAFVREAVLDILTPGPKDAAYPLWFVAFRNVVGILPGIAAVGYLLLDRRGLYRRVPALAAAGWRRELAACAIAVVAPLLATVLVGLFL